MPRAALLASAIAAGLATGASGAEALRGPARIAVDRFSREMTECAAYYIIVAEGLDHRGDAATAKRYHEAGAEFFNRAILFTDRNTIATRTIESIRKMRKAIGDRPERVDELTDEYGPACREILEHPEARLRQLIAEEKGRAPR